MISWKKFLCGFVIMFAAVFSVEAHPYHTSIADIRYNAKNQTLEIALKIFANDLEKTLSDAAKKPVTLNQTPAVQAQIAAYLKKVIAIELNPKQVLPLKYIGSEPEADTYWLYAEIRLKSSQLSQVNLRNQVLLETFDDQMNIVNLDINGKKKTLVFRDGDVVKPLL